MDIKEELERYVAELKAAGIPVDHGSMPTGVFFSSEQSAKVFADRFDKELVAIQGGWVARNRS